MRAAAGTSRIAILSGGVPTLMEAKMRGGGLISAIVVVWLVIGVIAAFQRGYLKNTDQNCASLGTIAVTVVVGPLNYAGVNPKVADCHLPQPSSMPAMDIENLIGMESS
jgi:membrane-bound ClpP family serine protease